MQTHLTLLLLTLAIGFTLSPAAPAQQSIDRKFDRLYCRYQINDIDGLGELIEPLWKQLIQGDAKFELAQKHLIAMAAIKFYISTGEHHLAILPDLVTIEIQSAIEKESVRPLVEPLDASFRRKHLPPIFFSDKDRRQFRSDLNTAIVQGVLVESELVVKYREATPNKLDKIQKEMLASISTAKASNTPSDREILRLIQSFVTHIDEHCTLAHESLATAIEALLRLNRNDEAERLRAAFLTQFPDSRRLER